MLDVEGPVRAAPASRPEKIPARIYGVMAVTTLLTFATLTTSYQLFFSYHPFA
ncbi:MAG: hypothetical protein ABI770_10260 [Sphingomicrobium sp.]